MTRQLGREEDFEYAPKVLSQRQKAALRLIVDGWKHKDAAEAMGYQQCRLSIIVNSDVGQAYLKELEAATVDKFTSLEASSALSQKRTAVRRRIDEEAETSLKRLLDIRDNSEDDALRARVSSDLLDRAGLKEPEKVEVSEKILATPSLLAALELLKHKAERKAV